MWLSATMGNPAPKSQASWRAIAGTIGAAVRGGRTSDRTAEASKVPIPPRYETTASASRPTRARGVRRSVEWAW